MKSQFDLSEKVVVVTGGQGLIGSKMVDVIRDNGGVAVSADLTAPSSDSIVMDITSKQSINEGLSEILKKHGKVSTLINNAYPRNANYGRSFFDVEYKDFSENLSMHLGGYFLCGQQFAQHFRKNGGGNIINIASIYGVCAPKFQIYQGTEMTMPVEYAAIKSSLIHLTKYMAKYLAGEGIRVNALSPGGILDKQPKAFVEAYGKECTSKGMLAPEDILGALLFLISDQSQFINGQNIVVDDGFSL